jgi:heat shock protein HslJ
MKKTAFLLFKKNIFSGFSLLFLFIALIFTQGCHTFPGEQLYNVHWKPVEKAPESVFLLFTSDKRRVVGCCGANRFFGPAKIGKDGTLSIGMLGATRMMSPHFRYEQKFLENLQAAKSYRFEPDGTLLFLDIDGSVCMRLRAVPPQAAGEK